MNLVKVRADEAVGAQTFRAESDNGEIDFTVSNLDQNNPE